MKSKIHKHKRKRFLLSKKQLFLFLLFGFIISEVYSQNTVVVAGGDAIGTNGKVSYSVGQIVYTYANGTNGSVNQGIQQPLEISTLGVDNFPSITLEMSVFPNPTINNVTLKISDLATENLSYQLSDVTGKQISNQKITKSEIQVNMENLTSAIYFLNVSNQNKTIKTFRIVKNQ